MGKWERAEYIYRREQKEYTYEKEKTEYIYDKANIQELYVKMNEYIFGMNLSHNSLKLLHMRVLKTKLLVSTLLMELIYSGGIN